jgi:arylsulfatase A-like enzyme
LIGLMLVCSLGVSSLAFLPFRADAHSAETRSTGPPHVVLLVLDTQRADYLGVYGGGDLTPSIDAFSEEGTVYKNAFSAAPWTVPSHASLFTGLYPISHGCSFRHHRWLDDEFTTVAEFLKGHGYQTAGFCSNNYLAIANLDQGFDEFEEIGARFRTLKIRRLCQLAGFPGKWADHGANDALEQVESYLQNRFQPDRPAFLFINLLEPHWRYLPALADRINQLPADLGLIEATKIAARAYGPLLLAGQKLGGPVDDVLAAYYAAAVRYQDRQVGRLVELVDRYLPSAETLWVITADHGENLGEAGRYDHVFAVNDHLIKVPLILRHTGRVAAGKKVEGLVQVLDIPATIAEAVEQEWPSKQAGNSLLGTTAARRFVIAEGDPYLGHLERMSKFTGYQLDVARFATHLRCVRDENHKLVWAASGNHALFDVRGDPDEVENLLPSRPEIAEELQAALGDWFQEQPRYHLKVGPDTGATLSEEDRARLEALGYWK